MKAGISGNSGFTFVEVSMVLLIISIFAVTAIPRFSALLYPAKAERSVFKLAYYLEHLRDEAIFKGRLLVLNCSIDDGKFSVTSPSGKNEKKVLMRPVTFPDALKIVDIDIAGHEKLTEGDAKIVFYPGGSSDGALIHLRNKADETDITLEISPFARNIKVLDGYVESI